MGVPEAAGTSTKGCAAELVPSQTLPVSLCDTSPESPKLALVTLEAGGVGGSRYEGGCDWEDHSSKPV
jgi:hypothetical protein